MEEAQCNGITSAIPCASSRCVGRQSRHNTGAGAPSSQAVLHQIRPARVALQRGRVADDDQRHPRARQADIDAPLVLDKADGAALARAHR